MTRWLMTAALAAMAVLASAQDCCEKKVVAQAAPKACCAAKGEKAHGKIVAQAHTGSDCCEAPAATDREKAFMAEAHRMMMAAEMKAKGEQECCQSTAEKPMAKGDPGCCNAPGAPAKFKVFVAGQGYKFFGCADSAGQGRTQLLAEGKVVGKVQKVIGDAKI